jgi:hypothetical protein
MAIGALRQNAWPVDTDQRRPAGLNFRDVVIEPER